MRPTTADRTFFDVDFLCLFLHNGVIFPTYTRFSAKLYVFNHRRLRHKSVRVQRCDQLQHKQRFLVFDDQAL